MYKLLLIIIISLFLVSCRNDTDVEKINISSDFAWSIIKSPITGLCYEIALRKEDEGFSGLAYMGMDKVDCQWYQEK